MKIPYSSAWLLISLFLHRWPKSILSNSIGYPPMPAKSNKYKVLKVWNINDKENIFVVKRGAKQQKGDGALIYMILLTLKYGIHICWCVKTFRIMDVCIKTTGGGNSVFLDNNKRIINVALITFRPYQWLKTKWWQMVTDWCFKIEITFEKSCHCCCHHIAKIVTSFLTSQEHCHLAQEEKVVQYQCCEKFPHFSIIH